MKRIIILALLLFPILVYAADASVDPTGPTFSYIEAATGRITTNLQADGENIAKHLGNLGSHVAQEKTATHVSINTNPHE
jgi:hypothetical protein